LLDKRSGLLSFAAPGRLAKIAGSRETTGIERAIWAESVLLWEPAGKPGVCSTAQQQSRSSWKQATSAAAEQQQDSAPGLL